MISRPLLVLLSFLFFLPSAVQADDILIANVSYHGDEMTYKDGEEFLAFAPEDVLAPVKIQVRRETADRKLVELPGFDGYTILVRGRNLHPGKITFADPDYVDLQPGVTSATLTLGTTQSRVFYRCGKDSCTLVLETDGVSQDLVTFPVERRGKEIFTEISHAINAAGDFDGDGKLDLIVNASTHWNESRPTLFLSTAATEGKLVGKTAELSMTGC